MFTLTGRVMKCHSILQTDSDIALAVHCGSYGKVCECEQCATLADAGTVQMAFLHSHFRYSRALFHLNEPHSVIRRKAVLCIEIFLQCHISNRYSYAKVRKIP